MPSSEIYKRPEFQDAFTRGDSFATTLVAILVDTYGTECFSYDPTTIVLEVERDFNIKMPKATGDRMMAGINLIISDDFYKSLPDFITFCNILSGDSYDPRAWDPADSEEIAWGMTEALMLSPPDDGDDDPFATEILAYIGATLDAEGIVKPPDVLRIALRDKDPQSAVNQFADDPEMFNAIYDLETSKTEAINGLIRGNLKRLAQQLGSLPLRNGNTKGVVEQMLRSFGSRSSPESGSII